MPSGPKLTQAKVKAALIATGGIYTKAAELLGCDRGTISRYVARYPKLAKIEVDAEDALLDYAIHAITKAVIDEKPWAVRFVLERKGASLGWMLPARPSSDPVIAIDGTRDTTINIIGGLPDGPDLNGDGGAHTTTPLDPADLGNPDDIIDAAAREIFG